MHTIKTRTATLHQDKNNTVERQGGYPGLSVLMSFMVSVGVKQHWTMPRHWSQFVPNMSADTQGHEALHHHHLDKITPSLSPGHYCAVAGLANVSGECSAGYYCTSAAIRPDPTDGTTGDRCTPGHYCPVGTGSPVQCPPGYFSNATGNLDFADCTLCTAGEWGREWRRWTGVSVICKQILKKLGELCNC